MSERTGVGHLTVASKRILVIEDEQIVALDLSKLLKRLGYAPLGPAASGQEAIRLAEQTEPDLILMDVRLSGGMDGLEASREIVRHRIVPIVYLTAYPDTFICAPWEMAPPYLCLAKPFSAVSVQAAVESALGIAVARPN